MERAREYSRSYRRRPGKREAINAYQRSYMRKYRHVGDIIRQVLSVGEGITLAELSQRMQMVEGVAFRSKTLHRMIRNYGITIGSSPLVEVEEDIYGLNAKYYDEKKI